MSSAHTKPSFLCISDQTDVFFFIQVAKFSLYAYIFLFHYPPNPWSLYSPAPFDNCDSFLLFSPLCPLASLSLLPSLLCQHHFILILYSTLASSSLDPSSFTAFFSQISEKLHSLSSPRHRKSYPSPPHPLRGLPVFQVPWEVIKLLFSSLRGPNSALFSLLPPAAHHSDLLILHPRKILTI